MIIAICGGCKHFDPKSPDGEPRCKAFPAGIPDAILFMDHDHHKPYPGDGGIRFEPLDHLKDEVPPRGV